MRDMQEKLHSILWSDTTGPRITNADVLIEILRTPLFTTTLIYVLRNYILKVLFNLSSWYLFAIGLWSKCELLLLELDPEPSSSRSSQHLHHDRFAHQNWYSPPSGFPQNSTWPDIVHHLSGPNIYALHFPNNTRMIGNCGTVPYGSTLKQNQQPAKAS